MKAYFSYGLQQGSADAFRKTISFIEKQMSTHGAISQFNFRPFLKNSADESEGDIFSKKEKLSQLYKTCDLAILEVSDPSVRIGAEVVHLLKHQKPILLLARHDSSGQEYFKALESHHILYAQYHDDLSLKMAIDSFFHSITDYSQARLTLHLEKPYIDFLEEYMKDHGISMSKAIEQIVENNIDDI